MDGRILAVLHSCKSSTGCAFACLVSWMGCTLGRKGWPKGHNKVVAAVALCGLGCENHNERTSCCKEILPQQAA